MSEKSELNLGFSCCRFRSKLKYFANTTVLLQGSNAQGCDVACSTWWPCVGLLSQPARLKKKKNLLTQTGVLDRIQLNAGLRQVWKRFRSCTPAIRLLWDLCAHLHLIDLSITLFAGYVRLKTRSFGDNGRCLGKLYHHALALLLLPLFISKISWLLLS